jgi:TolA-binding protein
MQPVTANQHEKRRLSDSISLFIHNWRYVMWGILILSALFIVGYFVWTEWNNKVASDSTVAVEKVIDRFDSWKAETDTAKRATLEKALLTDLDALVTRFPRQYGGQRALYMRAAVYADGKLWEKAAQDYLDVAARFPQSYLASMSLFDAGVCLEEKGNTEAALTQYARIQKEFGDSAVAPRALFSSGRLYEAKSSFEDAKKSYDALEADYPDSEWTKLAKNRIIALKVAGKLK